MKTAITTPTGQVSSSLVERLLGTGGHRLVLLGRDASRPASTTSRGAEAAEGDLLDPDFVSAAAAAERAATRY